MYMKFRDCVVHGSIATLKNFTKNLSTNFKKIAVFVKEPLEIVTKLNIEFHPDEYIFMLFEIALVYLSITVWVWCTRHLFKE